MNTWMQDLWRIRPLVLLTREEFVKRYMPQYAKGYESPTGIRTYTNKKTGRLMIPMSTKSSHQAQVTKRNNRIDSEYAKYKTTIESEIERNRKAEDNTLYGGKELF